MSTEQGNIYALIRSWFDFAFENPELIKPCHAAVYFFAIEHNNRLGWKRKFGFPSQMVMEAIGVKNWRTYSKTLTDLVDWGFIEMIEISKNQYSSNIIAIVKNTKAQSKALDKALQKHSTKQGTKQGQSTVSVDRQVYNSTTIQDYNSTTLQDGCVLVYPTFDDFWNLYDKKINKGKCVSKWRKLSQETKEKIMIALPPYIENTPDNRYRKNPTTYLNNNAWEDEVIIKKQNNGKETNNDIAARAAANYIKRRGLLPADDG